MSNGHWPLFDVRLGTPDLLLRPLTEADLGRLSEILPDDLEQNPASTTYAGLDGPANRAAIVHQDYWRALGSWRPEGGGLGLGGGRGVGPVGLPGPGGV